MTTHRSVPEKWKDVVDFWSSNHQREKREVVCLCPTVIIWFVVHVSVAAALLLSPPSHLLFNSSSLAHIYASRVRLAQNAKQKTTTTYTHTHTHTNYIVFMNSPSYHKRSIFERKKNELYLIIDDCWAEIEIINQVVNKNRIIDGFLQLKYTKGVNQYFSLCHIFKPTWYCTVLAIEIFENKSKLS